MPKHNTTPIPDATKLRVLRLTYVGFSRSEIATVLNISTASVSRIRREFKDTL